MSTTPSALDVHDVLNKLKDKEFISKILDQLTSVLQQMNAIGRYAFREYDQLLEKIENFKKALLNYVLDSMVYLELLKDNFAKKKYQEENDLSKARFIKSTLDKIDQTVLKTYLIACLDLISLATSLREKYGSTYFLIEYTILNLIAATLFGAAIGAVVGLALPFALPVEAGVGAGVGLIAGVISVAYKLTTHWREWKDDIENLEAANNRLAKAKIEGDHQLEQLNLSANAARITFQDISDLEQYVRTTYDGFVDLREILLKTATKKDS